MNIGHSESCGICHSDTWCEHRMKAILDEVGPLPECCPKCRMPMLDGVEHHTCQPSREESEHELEDERTRSALSSWAIDRRDAASDAHLKALLDIIGDEALAKDNPSWERVIEALRTKIAHSSAMGEWVECWAIVNANGEVKRSDTGGMTVCISKCSAQVWADDMNRYWSERRYEVRPARLIVRNP